jgi:hypothetical protein
MTIKGNQATGLLRVEGYPREVNNGGDRQLEDRFICQYGLWPSLVPSIGAYYGGDPSLLLQSKQIEREGDLAYVTLIYKYPEPLEPGLDADDTYESRTSLSQDEFGDYMPGLQWIRRMRKGTFTKNTENITKNVGKRVDPPGIQDPEENKWLKIGREIQVGNDYTEVVDTYEWRAEGWDESYGNAVET